MKGHTSMKASSIVGAAALLAFAGCSSYSEIAKWDPTVKVNDGETPIASFVTHNFDYALFWCIPLCTGIPWTEGDGPIVDDFNVQPFANLATVEGNIKSLNHALDVAGSHRIAQLRTTVDDDSFWSLFLVNRHEVRTQCLILPELPAIPETTKAPENP